MSWFSWLWNRPKYESDIIRSRIVSPYRADIFCQPPKVELIEMKNETNDVFRSVSLDDQIFTPEFEQFCKEYYSQYYYQYIRKKDHYYIQFSFMSTPCGYTYESDTNIEIVDYSTCWGNCGSGYIKSPKNHREYIPIRLVFRILCGLIDETGRPYTVNVQKVKYNTRYWEQDNMLLTFCFVQQPNT